MLHVSFLGSTEVRRDGVVVSPGGVKQRGLLAMLVLAGGHPVAGTSLVRGLWGEHAPGDPVHALHVNVSRLRRLVPIELHSEHGGYRLDPDKVEVDLGRFAHGITEGRRLLERPGSEAARRAGQALSGALNLWRGPPFADLETVSGLRAHRVHLEERRREALADRIDADLRAGATLGLASELQSILVDRPLDERHWAQLMTALAAEGRASEALTAFQDARAVLIAELGVEPGPRLAQLHQRLLTGGPPYPHERRERVAPGERRHTPGLLGRADELAVLDAGWKAAHHGLQLVTISGDAGIGKTRLAMEQADHLADLGATVLVGRCDESVTTPFQALAEAIRADVAGLVGDELRARLGEHSGVLVHVVPELAAELPAAEHGLAVVDAHTAQSLVATAVAGWLSEASRHRPLVLILDDLHWADQQTLTVLRHLARTRREVRALILVTFRDREHPADDPRGEFLSELARQTGSVRHLPLVGLDSDAAHDLLAAELEGYEALSAVVSDRVLSASGGNPLVVVELARDLALSRERDDELQLPTGVRELVLRRVRNLHERQQELLATAAVIGKEFDPQVLGRAADATADEIDELLDRASYARLVEPTPGASLHHRFTHDVARMALYETLSPLRRIRLHQRVGESIEEVFAADLDSHLPELAHHFSVAANAGQAGRAVEYLTRAGAVAMERRAPSVAVEHYRRARHLLGTAAPAATRCDLTTSLGIAELQAGDPLHRATLLEAAAIAHEADDHRRLTAAVLANNRGWWSSTSAVDWERVSFIEAALTSCPEEDVRARSRLRAVWALENVRDPSRRSRALAVSLEALDLAEALGDDMLLAEVMSHRYSVLHAAFSDPAGAMELSSRLRDLARRRVDPGLRLTAAIGLAQSAMKLGDFDTGSRELADALELCERLEQPARQWLTRCWQATEVARRGDLERAEELAAAAYSLGVESQEPDALTWFSGQLFMFRLLQGRVDEIIDEVEDHVTSPATSIPAWQAAGALALTAVGRHDQAGVVLERFLADDLAALPMDMLWLHGAAFLSGVCTAIGAPASSARLLYDHLAPYAGLVAHNGTIDAGPVDLHLASLARAMGHPELGDEHAEAAIRQCRRSGSVIWLEHATTGRGIAP